MKIKNPVLNIVTVTAHIAALVQTIPALFVFLFSFMSVPPDLYAGNISLSNLSLNNYLNVFRSTTGLKPVLTKCALFGRGRGDCGHHHAVHSQNPYEISQQADRNAGMLLQIPWFLPATLIASPAWS